MSPFWQRWLDCWCLAVGLFGLLVAGAGFAATDGASMLWLKLIGSYDVVGSDRGIRFAAGILGAVTFGWAASFAVALRATHKLTVDQGPIWRGYALAMLLWCTLDSAISLHTGFAINALTNTVFLVLFLVPIFRGGFLKI